MNQEKLNIIKKDDQTWIIDEGGVRFFLLAGDEKALMIDCGMMTSNALEIAATLTDKPIELILTHADMDHIGSIAQFDTFYMNPAESCNLYQGPKAGLIKSYKPVYDKDVLDLGNRELTIVELAGHTPGSIAILDSKNKVLISGDPIQDGNVFMFGPQREMHAYVHCLDKAYAMKDQYSEIWPSHGTLPVSAEIIPVLKDGALKILSGELEAEPAEFHGMKLKRYNLSVAGILSL